MKTFKKLEEVFTLEVVIVLGTILLLAIMIITSAAEKRAWEEFRETHACRIVAKTTPSVGTGTGITSGGNVAIVTTTSPGKTAWECNDGITYWR